MSAPTRAAPPAASASAHASDEPLVLASASPRRHRLLADASVAFEARPADVDETPLPGERARDTAVRLARAKADHVAAGLGPPRRLVLGADTIVVLGDALFGKPRDAAHARELLGRLTGRTHEVITAVAVAESDGPRVWECAVSSRVAMRAATPAEIEAYVACGESLDKAGGYALQGAGRRFVERVDGSRTNVIGLPVDETLALLERARRGDAP